MARVAREYNRRDGDMTNIDIWLLRCGGPSWEDLLGAASRLSAASRRERAVNIIRDNILRNNCIKAVNREKNLQLKNWR